MQQQVTTFAEAIAKLTGITEKEVMETFNIETLQLTEDIKHILFKVSIYQFSKETNPFLM